MIEGKDLMILLLALLSISCPRSPRDRRSWNDPTTYRVEGSLVVGDVHPPDSGAIREALLQDKLHHVLQADHGNAMEPLMEYPVSPHLLSFSLPPNVVILRPTIITPPDTIRHHLTTRP